MGLFRKKKNQDLLVDIRRADYLASITHSIGEAKSKIANCKTCEKQANELVEYLKITKQRKFRRVAKTELKIIKKEREFYEKQQKELLKLYEKAFKHAPGSR